MFLTTYDTHKPMKYQALTAARIKEALARFKTQKISWTWWHKTWVIKSAGRQLHMPESAKILLPEYDNEQVSDKNDTASKASHSN